MCELSYQWCWCLDRGTRRVFCSSMSLVFVFQIKRHFFLISNHVRDESSYQNVSCSLIKTCEKKECWWNVYFQKFTCDYSCGIRIFNTFRSCGLRIKQQTPNILHAGLSSYAFPFRLSNNAAVLINWSFAGYVNVVFKEHLRQQVYTSKCQQHHDDMTRSGLRKIRVKPQLWQKNQDIEYSFNSVVCIVPELLWMFLFSFNFILPAMCLFIPLKFLSLRCNKSLFQNFSLLRRHRRL